MKSQKGVTLTILVIYIVVFTIIIGIMTMISNHFYKNIYDIKDSPKYVSEFNKFGMFFIKDVKENTTTSNITTTSVQFEDGTIYNFNNNAIYRNDVKVAKYVRKCEFINSTYTVGEVTKNIVTVNVIFGEKEDEFTKSIDFVLRYW